MVAHSGLSYASPLRSGGLSLMAHCGPAGGNWPETAAAARPVYGSPWRSSVLVPRKDPAAAEIPLDAPDDVFEHGSHFAGPEMPESSEGELVLLLVPGAVQEYGVDVWIQPQVGGDALQDGHGACLRAGMPLLTRTPCVEPLHRLLEDPRERAEQSAVSSESRAPAKRPCATPERLVPVRLAGDPWPPLVAGVLRGAVPVGSEASLSLTGVASSARRFLGACVFSAGCERISRFSHRATREAAAAPAHGRCGRPGIGPRPGGASAPSGPGARSATLKGGPRPSYSPGGDTGAMGVGLLAGAAREGCQRHDAAGRTGRRGGEWLVLAGGCLLAAFAARPARAAEGLVLGPCPAPAKADRRCGHLSVPEDWSRPGGRRIELSVRLVPATQGAQPGVPPAYELAGGPGLAATSGDEPWPHRELVLVDQRGTGGSHPLHCETEGQGPLDEKYPIEMVRACRERLARDADLGQYTTANTVRDLEAVRAALRHERIDLLGISYGASLALSYVAAHPERVRRAVLIGVPEIGMRPPLAHGTNAQRALDRVFQACQGDAACATAFPKLREDWTQVLARLAREPLRLTHPSPRTGRPLELTIRRDVFGEAFRGVLGSRPWDVPFVIHRMAQGDYGPFLDRLPLDRPSVSAHGLYLSVDCPYTARITDSEAEAAARGTFLGRYRLDQQRRACAEWPHAAPAPDPAPRTDAPVLLISGTGDYITPPEWAAEIAGRLPGARRLVIEGLPHYPDGLSNMDCLWDVVDRFFLASDPDDLDTSCLATVKPPPFRTAADPPAGSD